jgi:hypothetical protein
MITETDYGLPRSEPTQFNLDVSKVSPDRTLPWTIDLQLIEYERAGLRTFCAIDGLGFGYVNDAPYSNIATARREHAKVVEAVQKGRYKVRILGVNQIRVDLTEQ